MHKAVNCGQGSELCHLQTNYKPYDRDWHNMNFTSYVFQ